MVQIQLKMLEPTFLLSWKFQVFSLGLHPTSLHFSLSPPLTPYSEITLPHSEGNLDIKPTPKSKDGWVLSKQSGYTISSFCHKVSLLRLVFLLLKDAAGALQSHHYKVLQGKARPVSQWPGLATDVPGVVGQIPSGPHPHLLFTQDLEDLEHEAWRLSLRLHVTQAAGARGAALCQ